MKGDAFLTFCQFCRKMAELCNSTTFHFINPSQTSEEEEEEEEKPLRYLGRLKSEFQNRRQKKKKKKDIYQPIKSKIGNHICCSCVIPELHSAFVSFPPPPPTAAAIKVCVSGCFWVKIRSTDEFLFSKQSCWMSPRTGEGRAWCSLIATRLRPPSLHWYATRVSCFLGHTPFTVTLIQIINVI